MAWWWLCLGIVGIVEVVFSRLRYCEVVGVCVVVVVGVCLDCVVVVLRL